MNQRQSSALATVFVALFAVIGIGLLIGLVGAVVGGIFYVFWNLVLHDAANLPVDRLPYWWQCVVFGLTTGTILGWFGKGHAVNVKGN